MIKLKINSKRSRMKIRLNSTEIKPQLYGAVYSLGAAVAELKKKDYALWDMTRKYCHHLCHGSLR